MIRPHSRSTSTTHGYRVEVRDNLFGYCPEAHSTITLADGIMVTDKWREVSTRQYPHSPDTFAAVITLTKSRCPEGALSDLLPYPTAMALATWLVSLYPLSQLQCRLVAYKLELTSTLTREGIVDEPLIVTEAAPDNLMGGKPKIKPEETTKP